MSERVDGGSPFGEGVVPGSCSTARPRPDVRRWRSRRGSEHQAKAQGRPFHPGVTGERQIGRVKYLNLWLMSRYGQLRWWDVAAGRRDWPQRSGRRRLGSALSREEHRRPRDTGGTHPGRSSCVRNAVTPVEVRRWFGRSADREGGPIPRRDCDDREANAGRRKATGNHGALASTLHAGRRG